MQERIEQLRLKALEQVQAISGRGELAGPHFHAFVDIIVKDVLQVIDLANTNQCAYTTYDAGVQECTRTELIRIVKDTYSVDYTQQPRDNAIFPVRSRLS